MRKQAFLAVSSATLRFHGTQVLAFCIHEITGSQPRTLGGRSPLTDQIKWWNHTRRDGDQSFQSLAAKTPRARDA